jgi:peptide chain release factor 1
MDLMNAGQIERRLDEVVAKHAELEARLGDPAVAGNPDEYRKTARQHAELDRVAHAYAEYRKLKRQLGDAKEMIQRERDPDMLAMAEAERDEAEERLPGLFLKLQTLMLPKDPLDEKNVILEIRAGTGGEEAALFAADLFRMYGRHAEERGWRMEMIDSTQSANGGFREVLAKISGEAVYSHLKFESGTHRVQRVPETEAQGRVHTSAATVAVLPEAEEVDVKINPSELRIDVFRSGGPGGQSVNTTDSAVRITHIPTGLVVQCQDEKSQHKNKAKALGVLRARLLDHEQSKRDEERATARKLMVGSGDRSERIRTYNFPQNRLTDHRINFTLHSLDRVMEGDLDDLIGKLTLEDQSERLQKSFEPTSAKKG